MFKLIAVIVYIAAPGFTSSATYRADMADRGFDSKRACVDYLNAHDIRVGLRLRAAAKSVGANGSLIESVQISCRQS